MGMNFADLQGKLSQLARLDVAEQLQQFRAAAPQATPEKFLSHLHERGVIGTQLFKELHTSEAVDASATVIKPSMRVAATAASSGVVPVRSAPANEEVIQLETDHYEVLGELGKGAMGEVHIARDVVLRRKVALKSILPHMQQNSSLYSRFLGEMQITAQLDHPSIVPVYGVENGPSGQLAYAMKLVQGIELDQLLSETRKKIESGAPLDGPHSLESRLETFLKVCDAIAYAHERGVVHRDLKPANIMIGRFNEVYVMDWGIAKLVGQSGSPMDSTVEVFDSRGNDLRHTARTRVGSTIGTPMYMSPEQAAGKVDQLDGRSDQYALGLMLQEIVTLKQAVGGTTLDEVLTNAKSARRLPAEPATPGADVPRELRAIIEKATRLRPEDRYSTVAALADDVRRFLRNEAVLAQPDTSGQRLGRWISKHRMLAAALLGLALLLGASATLGVHIYNRVKLAEKHNRELTLVELQAASALRAQGLDATFQRYERLMSRMAGAVGLSLARPTQADDQFYGPERFQRGPDAAPGLMDSAFYGKAVSFEWPVGAVAPDAAADERSRHAGSIVGLRDLARPIMLESLGGSARALSEEQRLRVLADTGVPIHGIALTLESGLHLAYPGMAGLAKDLDGRRDPLHQRAKHSPGVVWGPPTTTEKGGVLLQAATAVHDSNGEVIAVLRFDVDARLAVEVALDTSEAKEVETSLLVERTGKVLAQRSNQGGSREPETLAMADVRAAIERGDSGYLETQRDGRDVLVTFQPLSTVDWYLVTIANVGKVESRKATEGARPGSIGRTAPTQAAATAPPPAAPPRKPVATASAIPSAEVSASAEPSASAAPPALTGRLPTPSTTVSSPPIPPNPFDPWKAYEKGKPK